MFPSPPIELYPVIVRESRYGGVYEGGAWFAFSGFGFPTDAIGNDAECSAFWWSDRSILMGRGDSPDGAVTDLILRHEMYGNISKENA